MATLAARPVGPTPRSRRVPWSLAAWRQALFLIGGIPVQIVALLVIVLCCIGAPKVWPLPLIGLAAVFLALPALTWIQRQRLRATTGADIPARPGSADRWSPAGLLATVRSRSTWQQAAYHLLAAPLLAAGAVLSFVLWFGGAAYTLLYTWAWTEPAGSLLSRGQSEHNAIPLLGLIPVDLYLTVAGVAALLAAPWLTTAVTALDTRAAWVLLGPSRSEELQLQVERLTQTRAGAVDAADAERRRLARDLHDGTQQRLVSLALQLGMARAEQPDGEQARLVIAEAHEEAKAALVELRDLILG